MGNSTATTIGRFRPGYGKGAGKATTNGYSEGMEAEPNAAPPPRPRWIFIDADACPVKDEVYRVAARYGVPVRVVANAPMRVPAGGPVELVVRPGFGAADD